MSGLLGYPVLVQPDELLDKLEEGFAVERLDNRLAFQAKSWIRWDAQEVRYEQR